MAGVYCAASPSLWVPGGMRACFNHGSHVLPWYCCALLINDKSCTSLTATSTGRAIILTYLPIFHLHPSPRLSSPPSRIPPACSPPIRRLLSPIVLGPAAFSSTTQAACSPPQHAPASVCLPPPLSVSAALIPEHSVEGALTPPSFPPPLRVMGPVRLRRLRATQQTPAFLPHSG